MTSCSCCCVNYIFTHIGFSYSENGTCLSHHWHVWKPYNWGQVYVSVHVLHTFWPHRPAQQKLDVTTKVCNYQPPGSRCGVVVSVLTCHDNSLGSGLNRRKINLSNQCSSGVDPSSFKWIPDTFQSVLGIVRGGIY